MARRLWRMLPVTLLYPAILVAQTPVSTPASQRNRPATENCTQTNGTLDPSVYELNTGRLKDLIVATALRNLAKAMQEKMPNAGATQAPIGDDGLAKWYIDPASIGPEEGQDPAVIRIGVNTRIQIFGEQYKRVPSGTPCAKNGVLTIRVAMPQDSAKSVEDILKNDAVTLDRCATDLTELEVVTVPLITPDKDQCQCDSSTPCFTVSTLTVIPSKVFEDKPAAGPGSAVGASFSASSSQLRQEKQRIEREADKAGLITWFRTRQHDKQTTCFTIDEVLFWAKGVPDAGAKWQHFWEEWQSFWKEVDKRIESIRAEDAQQRDRLLGKKSGAPDDREPPQGLQKAPRTR